MESIIDSYFNQHKELSNFLLQKTEISLKSDADKRFSKVLVLACASYFEEGIISAISNYSEALLNGDEKISSLLRMKAFERQYHTLFDWKENNANRLFSHFGEGIKKRHKEDITQDNEIKESERVFMTLGRMRNVLVHSNFVVTPIDETHEEIYEMFKTAMRFVTYVESMFQINEDHKPEPV